MQTKKKKKPFWEIQDLDLELTDYQRIIIWQKNNCPTPIMQLKAGSIT